MSGISLTTMPCSRSWSGQIRCRSIDGKYSDCGKMRMKVMNESGQSYAMAAVTILTPGSSGMLGWNPWTDTC